MDLISTYCTTELTCGAQSHGLKRIKIINVAGFHDVEDDIFIFLE